MKRFAFLLAAFAGFLAARNGPFMAPNPPAQVMTPGAPHNRPVVINYPAIYNQFLLIYTGILPAFPLIAQQAAFQEYAAYCEALGLRPTR